MKVVSCGKGYYRGFVEERFTRIINVDNLIVSSGAKKTRMKSSLNKYSMPRNGLPVEENLRTHEYVLNFRKWRIAILIAAKLSIYRAG